MGDSPKLLGLPVVLDPSVPVGEVRIERRKPESYTPAPGTRVTVGGVTWEYDSSGHWTAQDQGRRAIATLGFLTRIAELEAEVAELEDELTELRPLARAANDILNDHEKALARLARYEALGKEADEKMSKLDADDTEEYVMGLATTASIAERLAAEWRAQQEGR